MIPLMLIHVTAGGVGLIAGFIAILTRKGGRVHRAAGTVFLGAMLVMGGFGAWLALWMPERITVLAGLLVAYLVATGWMSVRRAANTTGRFEVAAMLVALGVAAAGLTFGVMGMGHPKGLVDSLPYQVGIVFGVIAGLAAVADLTAIRRSGLAGAPRLARHLWRMSAALLIAALAFFMGQQKVMPEAIRGSPVLFLPELLVLGTMIFWLVRVRLKQAPKPALAPA